MVWPGPQASPTDGDATLGRQLPRGGSTPRAGRDRRTHRGPRLPPTSRAGPSRRRTACRARPSRRRALVLVAERAGLVVDRDRADDRVAVALGAVAAGEDVVLGPPRPELGACHRQLADERLQLGVVWVAADVTAQDRDVLAGDDRPVDVQVARRRVEEDPTGMVAVARPAGRRSPRASPGPCGSSPGCRGGGRSRTPGSGSRRGASGRRAGSAPAYRLRSRRRGSAARPGGQASTGARARCRRAGARGRARREPTARGSGRVPARGGRSSRRSCLRARRSPRAAGPVPAAAHALETDLLGPQPRAADAQELAQLGLPGHASPSIPRRRPTVGGMARPRQRRPLLARGSSRRLMVAMNITAQPRSRRHPRRRLRRHPALVQGQARLPRRRGMAVGRHAARLSLQRDREGRGPGRSATAVPQPDPISLEPTFQHEGLNHFCLAIEDFDGTLAELRARGVEFVGEPFAVEEINRNLASSRTTTATSSSSRRRCAGGRRLRSTDDAARAANEHNRGGSLAHESTGRASDAGFGLAGRVWSRVHGRPARVAARPVRCHQCAARSFGGVSIRVVATAGDAVAAGWRC